MKDITENSAANYALRLPRSIKKEVERLAKQDGTSINQFIATAVAEKIAAIEAAQYFAERQSRADFTAFNRIMNRSIGAAPRPGDELPN
jgi:hypothetical protein